MGLVLGQDAAARLIHKIPVAKLVVGIGHVAVVAGSIVDLFRGFHQVVPGPGLVRVSNAGSIEHFLVIYQAHGVLVLRHTVQHAIGTACIGQRNVREMLGLHNVGAVCQFAVVGIFQDLVGMHPENIRHLVGHGGSFQLGPVFVPVDDLHFNMYIGMLGRVGVAHGLHTVALGHIPDLKGQVYGAVICSASG